MTARTLGLFLLAGNLLAAATALAYVKPMPRSPYERWHLALPPLHEDNEPELYGGNGETTQET